jgi:hypothetical protein
LTICSSAFAPLGRAQARNLGCADLPIIVVQHPFGSHSREAIREIAAHCAQEIARIGRAI